MRITPEGLAFMIATRAVRPNQWKNPFLRNKEPSSTTRKVTMKPTTTTSSRETGHADAPRESAVDRTG